jgi:TetR/AcrR family fatty acid metabolism transcriptional regulator
VIPINYDNYLRRKDKLLISAIELLDESGVSGVNTKEMARREGISEPAVYRHFENKLDILLSIIEKFSSFDSRLENTVIEQKMEPIAAIRHLCTSYASYYSSYPQIASVMFSEDLLKYNPLVKEKLVKVISRRKQIIRELVQQAQETGKLKEGIDSGVVADLISGIVWQCTFEWKMKDMGFNLQERVAAMLEFLLKGSEDDE